jgi:hypothetical protein
VLTPARPDADASAALALLSSAAVRERAHEMLELGLSGKLENFRIDMARLPETAALVAGVIRTNYPNLNVPLHARWRHFVFGDRDLWRETASAGRWRDAPSRARAAFDLVCVSVLLDAGAGTAWRFTDAKTGIVAGRSEGLALASLRMFESGLFSSDAGDPFRADAARLAALSGDELARGFGAGPDNPLPGLDKRAALLARLGRAMLDHPEVFARKDSARPGGLFDLMAAERSIAAADILRHLLIHLGSIWEDRLTLGGVPLGDTWRHRAVRRADATNGLVPLHKLSQWLAYSLIEPLRDAGVQVTEVDGLTGLAEYRNGGLFVDAGVLVPRDRGLAERSWPVDCEPVVEWRALTVALLDRIAPPVIEQLGMPAATPLGSILEGGTWAAGRAIARDKRPDGRPPIAVVSDGTVF